MNEYELNELCELFRKNKLIKEYHVIARNELTTTIVKSFPCAIIQNTSTRNGDGNKHWIVHVLYKIKKKKIVNTFDSMGNKFKFSVNIGRRTHKNVNQQQIQCFYPSNICGLYCLWFVFIRLVCLQRKYNFKLLSNLPLNDKFVSVFYSNVLHFQLRKDFIEKVYPYAMKIFPCQC